MLHVAVQSVCQNIKFYSTVENLVLGKLSTPRELFSTLPALLLEVERKREALRKRLE